MQDSVADYRASSSVNAASDAAADHTRLVHASLGGTVKMPVGVGGRPFDVDW